MQATARQLQGMMATIDAVEKSRKLPAGHTGICVYQLPDLFHPMESSIGKRRGNPHGV